MGLFGIGPPTEVICPHPGCFEVFHPREVLYRDPEAQGEPELGRWSRLRGLRPPPTLRAGAEKICPSCRRRLPRTAGSQPSLLIGLVGGMESGKSHYVATLVHQLRHEVALRFNFALVALDQSTMDRYRSEFYEPLFEHRSQIDKTQATAAPLLYELSIAPRDGRERRLRSVTLALYDTAGDFFESMQDVATNTPYLRRVAGLVLLVDPLQIAEVRDHVGSAAALPQEHPRGRPMHVIQTVMNELTKSPTAQPGARFETPLAVTATKCDVLRDVGLIPGNCAWSDETAVHDGTYDRRLHDAINGLFAERIRRWVPDAHQTVAVRFADYAFFGISATGCSPGEDRRYDYVAPWRVEEPLLWLLWRLGVLRD